MRVRRNDVQIRGACAYYSAGLSQDKSFIRVGRNLHIKRVVADVLFVIICVNSPSITVKWIWSFVLTLSFECLQWCVDDGVGCFQSSVLWSPFVISSDEIEGMNGLLSNFHLVSSDCYNYLLCSVIYRTSQNSCCWYFCYTYNTRIAYFLEFLYLCKTEDNTVPNLLTITWVLSIEALSEATSEPALSRLQLHLLSSLNRSSGGIAFNVCFPFTALIKVLILVHLRLHK